MRRSSHRSDHAPGAAAAILPVALAALLAVLIIAFAWPAARTAPRDVPLAVAGPPPAVDMLTTQVANASPGAFDIHRYADAAQARAAILDRDVYGAIVVGPDGPQILVASAGSPVVAQVLTQIAQHAADGGPIAVEDVVPAPAEDPRGAGLAGSVLPLVLVGMVAGVLLSVVVVRPGWVLLGLTLFAVAAGLTAAGLVQGWFGSLDGSYGTNAAVLSLTLLAIATPLAGLGALFGRLGLGLGTATFMLVGNPLSGLASAPEMLPQPWGALGQLMPPGAGGTLLRSVAFFDGAAAAAPLTVLGSWVVGGLILLGLAALRRPLPGTPATPAAPVRRQG